jgi:hypothetical protein
MPGIRLFLFFYFFYFDDFSVNRLSLIPLLGNDRRPRRRVIIVAGVVLGVSPFALEKAEDFTAEMRQESANTPISTAPTTGRINIAPKNMSAMIKPAQMSLEIG